jgi:hypothetical protein
VVGLLAFNVVAGSLYQLQLMGLFWPIAGVVLATVGGTDTGSQDRVDTWRT